MHPFMFGSGNQFSTLRFLLLAFQITNQQIREIPTLALIISRLCECERSSLEHKYYLRANGATSIRSQSCVIACEVLNTVNQHQTRAQPRPSHLSEPLLIRLSEERWGGSWMCPSQIMDQLSDGAPSGRQVSQHLLVLRMMGGSRP